MRSALVVLVAVFSLGGVWWSVQQADEVVTPTVEAPLPVVVAVRPQLRAERIDAGVPALEDPGVITKPVDVIFDVRRDGVHAVGARVTVTQGEREVSGLVNVMGGLTLPLEPLEPGEWSVQGEHFWPERFVVSNDTRVVSLELLVEKRVGGRVINEQQSPVGGVTVTLIDRHGVSEGALTDQNGRFSFRVVDKTVDLIVEDEDYASRLKRVDLPAEDVELVVEPTFPLDLSLSGGVLNAGVQVSHRLGNKALPCRRSCVVHVPTGDYLVLGVSKLKAELVVARAVGTQGSKGDSTTLVFTPAPPLSGVAKNGGGAVMADVPLRLLPAFSGNNFRGEQTVTKNDGSFSFDPNSLGSSFGHGWVLPSWRLDVLPPWKGAPVYVSFGDAPVTLTVESPTP